MSRQMYKVEISNPELNEFKVVRASSAREAEAKAQRQLEKWDQELQRLRQQQFEEAQTERAAQMTDEAQARLDEWRSILKSTLLLDDRVDWESLKDHTDFQVPKMEASPPVLEDIYEERGVPQKSLLESLFTSRRDSRVAQEEAAGASVR